MIVTTARTLPGSRAGKGLRPRIDPDDLKRQRRQRQDQGAAHMAGAEEQHGRLVSPKYSISPPSDDSATARSDSAGLATCTSRFSPSIDKAAAGHKALAVLQCGELLCLGQRRFIERLQQQGHPAAAALAEFGPQGLADPARPGSAAPAEPAAPRPGRAIPACRRRWCRGSRHRAARPSARPLPAAPSRRWRRPSPGRSAPSARQGLGDDRPDTHH